MCVLQQVLKLPVGFPPTKVFTHEGFYARKLLRTKVFTRESYSLEKLFPRKLFPRKVIPSKVITFRVIKFRESVRGDQPGIQKSYQVAIQMAIKNIESPRPKSG